jgi:hypothetical protein
LLRHTCPGGRWIGIPEARHIGGKNGPPDACDREEALENPPGVGARMQTEEGSALLEATARRDGVVDV